MEISELMIDDWVCIKTYTEEATNVGSAFYETWKPKRFSIDDFKENYPETDLKPIPITGRLLQRNGFDRYQDNVDNYFTKEIGSARIKIYMRDRERIWRLRIENYPDLSVHVLVKYMHEIQHVFRFCGLFAKMRK